MIYRKVFATITAGMNDANDINTEKVQTRLFEKNDVVIHPCNIYFLKLVNGTN